MPCAHNTAVLLTLLLHIFFRDEEGTCASQRHPPATRKQYGNSGSESPETERRYLAQRAPRSVSLLRPRWCEFSIRSVLRVSRSLITLGSTLLLCRGRTLPRGSETPGSVSISITSQRSVPGRITRILPGARVRTLATTQYRGKPGYYCRAWRGPMEQPSFIFDFRSATTLRWFTVAVHRTFAVRLCMTQCRVSVHSFMWFTLCQLTWLYVLIWTTHHGCTGTRTYGSTGSETYAPTFCMFFSHVRIKWKLLFFLEGNFDRIYLSNKVVHSSYQTIKADQEREREL